MPADNDILRMLLERSEQQVRDTSDIKVTLAENTHSLKEHMRRTEHIERRFEPIEKSQAMWAGVNKLVVVLGAVAGLAAAVFGLLR